jgi:DNA mismatch endonuclease (patch repair protein)
MSRIRGKHTTPELRVRSLLHRLGYRFRLHVRITVTLSASPGEIPSPLWGEGGRRPDEVRRTNQMSRAGVRCRIPRSVCPDLVLPKHRLAIFVHGCFWHRHPGCKNCTTPTARRDWWLAKLNGNAARDKIHQHALRQLGWRTLVVWECETEKPEKLNRLRARFARALPSPPRTGT